MDAATIPPMCGRYASFLPAEATARIFGTVNPLPNLAPTPSMRGCRAIVRSPGYVRSLGPLCVLG